MLTLYRRHGRSCPHRSRDYRRCRCPLWVQGSVGGTHVRKSLDLTSWEAGQEQIRDWEVQGDLEAELIRVEDAVTKFLADAEARALRKGSIARLRVVLEGQLLPWCAERGIVYLKALDVESMREFRGSWQVAPITALKKLERLRSFFRFCVGARWVADNPAKEVKSPRVQQVPTLPFDEDEWQRIVAALDIFPDNYGRPGGENAARLRAFVLLLRYSGLRIGDAVRLPVRSLADSRLRLYTQKTGVPVDVPLPENVVEALTTCPRQYDEHYFWSGDSTDHTATNKWRARLAKLFRLAKVENGHAHRFRDTFAVRLLEKGVPLEAVAVLLGHSDPKITWKHYAPWVKSRQVALEEQVRRAWS